MRRQVEYRFFKLTYLQRRKLCLFHIAKVQVYVVNIQINRDNFA